MRTYGHAHYLPFFINIIVTSGEPVYEIIQCMLRSISGIIHHYLLLVLLLFFFLPQSYSFLVSFSLLPVFLSTAILFTTILSFSLPFSHLSQVNTAEALFWRASEGERLGDSTDILVRTPPNTTHQILIFVLCYCILLDI